MVSPFRMLMYARSSTSPNLMQASRRVPNISPDGSWTTEMLTGVWENIRLYSTTNHRGRHERLMAWQFVLSPSCWMTELKASLRGGSKYAWATNRETLRVCLRPSRLRSTIKSPWLLTRKLLSPFRYSCLMNPSGETKYSGKSLIGCQTSKILLPLLGLVKNQNLNKKTFIITT